MSQPVNAGSSASQDLIVIFKSGQAIYNATLPELSKLAVKQIDSMIKNSAPPERQAAYTNLTYNGSFLSFQAYHIYNSSTSYLIGMLCGIAVRIVPRILPRFVAVPQALPKINLNNETKTEYCLLMAISSLFFSTMLGGAFSGFFAGNGIAGRVVDHEEEVVVEAPKPPPTLRERIASIPWNIATGTSNLFWYFVRRN